MLRDILRSGRYGSIMVAQVVREVRDGMETCEIIYAILDEKWGIFRRETVQFRAVEGGIGRVIAKSSKFELEKFNTTGPNEGNPKHRAAYDALAAKLAADGWEVDGRGDLWFRVFWRRRG